MKNKLNFLKKRTLLTETMLIFIVSFLIVTYIITQLVINVSEKKYLEAYIESNNIVLERISIEYEALADSLTEKANTFIYSKEVSNYLTSEQTNFSSVKTNYDLNLFLKDRNEVLYNDMPHALILLGLNGNTYYDQDQLHQYSAEALLDSPVVKQFETASNQSSLIFLSNGLTKASYPSAVLVHLAKIMKNRELIGYCIIEIKEENFSKIYSTLLDKRINHLSITDDHQTIISSNKKSYLNKRLTPSLVGNKQTQRINNLNLTINSQLHPNLIKKKMKLSDTIFYLLLLIIGLSFIILSRLFKRHLEPLNTLVSASDRIREGDFSSNIQTSGTIEVQTLISSFNYMQEGLQKYIEELVIAEKEKKEIEIQALQLQIKPHFIYNTLSSIKFLVAAGENEKAQVALEAFIRLLEQTIYNDHELVTLSQELDINEHLITILKIRHDKQAIQFITNIEPGLKNIKIPKLLLQPFVENAFLHAFVGTNTGSILINISQQVSSCLIEILDTGIGYDKQNINPEYSGIGVKNVQERLGLIYGNQYDFKIESQVDVGTIVTITLPLYADSHTSTHFHTD